MKDGSLKEIFGAGTAAVVSVIRAFCYKDATYDLPVQEDSMALKLKEKMTNIQHKLEDDPFGWTVKVG